MSVTTICPLTGLVLEGTADLIPRRDESGPEWEVRFFGCTAAEYPEPSNLAWPIALHLAIAASVQSARRWDPQCPHTNEASALYDAVCAKLRPVIRNRCALFNAIGTPMDGWHGADGIFMIYGEPDGVVVTIDLTVNPQKPNPDRSNRFIVRPDDIDDPGKLDRLASDIAHELERLCGYSNGNGHQTEIGALKKRRKKKKKRDKERD